MLNIRVKKCNNPWLVKTILLFLLLLVFISIHYYLIYKLDTNTNTIKLICEPTTGIKSAVVYEVEVDSLAEIKNVYKKQYDAKGNLSSNENIGDIYLNGTAFYRFTAGLGNAYQCYEK